MSGGRGVVHRSWQGAATILVVAVLAAVAVVLTARDLSGVKAERAARAAVADAVAPVADALRTSMSKGASGTATGERQVAFADRALAGVPSDTAIQARDSGTPVLEDSDHGVVVVASYDTTSPPASVEERRAHLTGLRIVPLDLGPTLKALAPARGGISLAGPRRTIQSVPGPRPHGPAAYDVKLAPGPAPDWTLTAWAAPLPLSWPTWLTAFGIVLAGVMAAGLLVRVDDRSRRSQQELVRLREMSTTTAALATVAQHSLDLADLLPALTTELVTALGLRGLSMGAPTAGGERLFFTWGEVPATRPASSVLPTEVAAGETLCMNLAQGGRTVARLRAVAGRPLDEHDLSTLGAAIEILTSALVNAEAFAQQRHLLERMRSVDELKTVFLATASHELRTPVGVIKGYAEVLASSWESLSSDEARTCTEQIDSNARRLSALVDDLLDFSRLERGVAGTAPTLALDLGDTVDQIIVEQPDLAPRHQLIHQVVPGLEVIGSWEAVERVVSNLVGNAAKYSPQGSVIRVTVQKSGDRAELVVEDEGPGIPPRERDQVFSRFFRGRGDSVVATRGAGLGLAIVTEFAATMGGQVSVTSAAGGGARFIASYPLAVSRKSSVEGAADVNS